MNLQACVIRYFPIPVYVLKVVACEGTFRSRRSLVQHRNGSTQGYVLLHFRISASGLGRPSVGRREWARRGGVFLKIVRKYGSTEVHVLPYVYVYTFKAHEVFTYSVIQRLHTTVRTKVQYYFYVHIYRTTMYESMIKYTNVLCSIIIVRKYFRST